MLKALWIKVPALLGATAAFVWLDGPLAYGVAFGILFAGAALSLVMMMHPNASLWAPTVWRAPHETNAVALTFDDGPDPAATPLIARILEEQNIRAAFFVVGERARKHPEIVARLHAAGHVVCNHSDSHSMTFHFGLWGAARRELRACNEAIASVIGMEPTLFRSPQGHKSPMLGDVLHEMGMTAVGWQVRGFDSMGSSSDAIVSRILNGARPGGVIMLHDGGGYGGRMDRSATVDALRRIIEGLRERGLQFVRLDELLAIEPYRSA